VSEPGHAGRWTFVTHHFLVLLCIAEDPGIRISDVADRVGITERTVGGIVSDLVKAGYLTRTRVGRRNHYEVHREMPLRHLETQHRRLGEMLALLVSASPGVGPRERTRTGPQVR
jgi:DNA-binding Lrp family transcriptional regulator